MSEIICTACGHEAKQHSAVSGGNFMQGCEALLGNPVHTCLCELSQSEVECNAQLAAVTAQRDALLLALKSAETMLGNVWNLHSTSVLFEIRATIATIEAGTR